MIYKFNNLQDVTLYRQGVMFKGEGGRGRKGWTVMAAGLALVRVIDLCPIGAAQILKIPRIIYLAPVCNSSRYFALCLSLYLTQTGGFPPVASECWMEPICP